MKLVTTLMRAAAINGVPAKAALYRKRQNQDRPRHQRMRRTSSTHRASMYGCNGARKQASTQDIRPEADRLGTKGIR